MKKAKLQFVLLPSTDMRIQDPEKLAALNTLLKRGRLEHHSFQGDIVCMLQHLGAALDTSEVPVAAIERYACDMESQLGEWCIKAQPVSLVPNRDDLLLRDGTFGDGDQTLEYEIIDGLNQYLSEKGILFRRLDAWQWIAESERPYNLSSPEISQTANRNIGEHLMGGEDISLWRNINNDIQMWLHDKRHRLMGTDDTPNLPNSLWFWGAGTLPGGAICCSSDLIVGDSLFLKGIAKLADVQYHTIDSFMSNMPEVLTHYQNISVFPCGSNMQILLDDMDKGYISTLVDEVKGGGLSELLVSVPNGNSVRYCTTDQYRFWRRSSTLAQLLSIA